MRRRLPYGEGTWFLLPLKKGGYAPGVVARSTASGKVIVVYLFARRYEAVPAIIDVADLGPADAAKVLRIGDLGLMDGTWPTLGTAPGWNREHWPTPSYVRRDELSGNAWRVTYADDDPNLVEREERIPYETAGLERNSVLGSGLVETVMTRLLERAP